MEKNPGMERNRKLEDYFQRVEQILTENFEVIGKLLVPKIKEREEETT